MPLFPPTPGDAVDSVNTQTGTVVLDQDDVLDGTTNKQYSATEKTKLSGIATGATANSTDVTLLARANHTGTQTAATISDFSTASDARITAATGVSVQGYSANTTTLGNTTTGTGSIVRATSPAITTPTGIVKGDVGLGNVDNTADTAKPISTDTQTALNLKQAKPTEVTVATAATTVAKVGTTSGGAYTPVAGDEIEVTFVNGTNIASPTLAIDGGAAVAIRIGESAVSTATFALGATASSNIKARLWYDGTYWRVYGSSDNTTYPVMTQAEAETGTAATGRAMSAVRLKDTIAYHAPVTLTNTATLTNKTLTSPVIETDTSVTGAAGTNRSVYLKTAGVNRLELGGSNSAEGGANAGTDLFVNTYDDAGVYIATPLVLTRSSGLLSLNNGLSVSGSLSLGGVAVPTISSTSTFTNKTITAPVISNYTDYTAITDPATPASGVMRMYAKAISDRVMPKVLTPSGRDFPLQPALFQNTIRIVTPLSGATLSTFGGNVTSVGTISTPAKTEAGGFMSNFVTAGTAAATAGTGDTAVQWHRGSITGGANGFFIYQRLRFPDASYDQTGVTTGSRIFVGLTNQTMANSVASDTPAGHIAGFFRCHVNGGLQHTNWRFMTRDNTTTTLADTSMAFAVSDVFDFYVYCRPHPDNTTIYWRIDNVTAGTSQEGSATANLPGTTTALRNGFQVHSVDAVARNVQMSRIYGEADR